MINQRRRKSTAARLLVVAALSFARRRGRCVSLRRVNLWQEVVVATAAFAAGMINSVAGGGTLVSFPALLWVGRDAVLANATSTVALWPASLAGVFGFRRELKGNARNVMLFGGPSLVGGVLGAF